MLRWRFLLGAVIIAVLVSLSWLDAAAVGPVGAWPGTWLLPALVAFTVLGTAETLQLARAAGAAPLAGVVHAGNLLLVTSPWLPLDRLGLADGWLLALLSILVILLFLGEMMRFQRPGGVLVNLAAATFALVYVGVLLSFAVRLRMGWGVGALAAWIIAVKMGDTGAYTVGRLIGRHKMCPTLSPGKTIEGAVGALAFACLGAWAGLAWLGPGGTVGSGGWLVFGLLMGAIGMIGDLAESLLKRDAGRKDSSTWMPGFGGVLDILDSLLLTAPVAWLCWRLGLFGG